MNYSGDINIDENNEIRLEDAIFTLADIMLRLNLNRNYTKKIILELIVPKYQIKDEKVKDIKMKLE